MRRSSSAGGSQPEQSADAERFRRIEALFQEAVQRSGDERSEFLATACANDAELRQAVEALLESDDAASRFLSESVPDRLTTSATSHGLSGGARIGPYEIVDSLGHGGMGEVYVARRADGAFDREVALKVVRADAISGESERRFAAERVALARLDHPGIARLHDGGELADGRPWFALELVDGRAIDRYCTEEQLGLDARLRLFLDVCDAVAHAHRRLLLHRDLKPSNVLVTPDGRAKLLDFGIAKFLEDGSDPITRGGRRWLTPEFASPEQVRDEPLTTASDVYSLGVLLYGLLTGRHPTSTPGADWRRDLDAVVEREPIPPSQVANNANGAGMVESELRGNLDAVLMRALAKDPLDRYRSVDELRADLLRHLQGEVVRTRRAPLRERALRFVRRRKALVAGLAAVALAIVSGALLLRAGTDAHQAAARTFEESRREALDARELADAGLASLTRMSDAWLAQELLRAAEEDHWPLRRSAIEGMQQWVRTTEELLGRMPSHHQTEETLRLGNALAGPPLDPVEREWLLSELRRLRESADQLALDDATVPGTLAEMHARIERAEKHTRESLEDAEDAWIDAIVDIEFHDGYGFEMQPQDGLIPLGIDEESGLWEFWVVGTGEDPVRDVDGRIEVRAEMALVLVLIPGGTAELGCQADDPDAPNFDPLANPRETRYRVELDPFFLSKYEVTQAQWLRLSGTAPSRYREGHEHFHSTLQAAESLAWDETSTLLGHYGLGLPTESQWEYAARGGTDTPFWCGDRTADVGSTRAGNVADQRIAASRPQGAAAFDDGYTAVAPIGLYAQNPYGLHDVIGNVFEWCADWYRLERGAYTSGNALRDVPDGDERVIRGGAFIAPAEDARHAFRGRLRPLQRSMWVGVRPARAIEGLSR